MPRAPKDVPVFERDDYMSLSNRQAAIIKRGEGAATTGVE